MASDGEDPESLSGEAEEEVIFRFRIRKKVVVAVKVTFEK